MSALDDARAHLDKAREFADAAEITLESGLANAATSNAVTAGINAKDAICLKLTGRSGKSEDHRTAEAELRAAGGAGIAQATELARLLRLKQRSQYQASPVSQADARRAVERAARLVEAAERIVGS